MLWYNPSKKKKLNLQQYKYWTVELASIGGAIIEQTSGASGLYRWER